MVYEVRGTGTMVASTTDAATALLLAREWLREPEQVGAGTHTCLVYVLDDGHLIDERIVALWAGPFVG